VPAGYAPLTHIGRLRYSAQHPTWWLDLFDFGIGEYNDQLSITFDHIYDNPERDVPISLAVIPEFAGLRRFALNGYRLLEDGETREAFNSSYEPPDPMRGDEHVWVVQSSPDLRRYQLKDPADWSRFKKLQHQSIDLDLAATKFDYEMRDLLRIVEPSEMIDKDVK